jgi:hypothetical protein
MTRDEWIDMARCAGFEELFKNGDDWVCFTEEIGILVALVRKHTCNDLANQIDKMPFGDTAASFAVWIREQA